MNEYDKRQYNFLLRLINSYKKNEMGLGKLISDLEGLFNCLEEKEKTFEKQFFHHWSQLEIFYAMNLDRENMIFTESEKRMLMESLDKIENLVKQQINKQKY